uniref:Uncharacterized protein n=1 Tax=Rhizophora mucronata TaxID=61149 RepID=A0A2P2NMA9_RHIMU
MGFRLVTHRSYKAVCRCLI